MPEPQKDHRIPQSTFITEKDFRFGDTASQHGKAMKVPSHILPIATIGILAHHATATLPLPTDEHGDYNGADLIEWINSHPQGYVHPSVRIGRERPGDPTSMLGLYVSSAPGTKSIEEDEIIARIPWSHLISPGEEYSRSKFFSCQEIRNLAKELKLGDNSRYAPYVRYLLAQPRGAMPGEWSNAGKKFFAKLLDYGDLPPYEETWLDVYETEWIKGCHGDPEDPMERMAFYLASSRDEDTLMIPIYDMANHSNDPDKLNTLSFKPDKVGKSFRFEASRTILPGEQIYNSYNRCNPCSEADFDNCETFSSQPTPDMFAHFGFVESLPQYWRFDSSEEGEEEDEIEMCLSRNSSGELEVLWFKNSMPDEVDFEYLSRHLKRLKGMNARKADLESKLVLGNDEDIDEKKMPRSEWESIWRYYDELVRAIEAAIKYAPPDDEEDEL
ncbi:hypothetical protein HJC23_013007 [Cyclotella cryptica]|uniref:SET domain-containing protein n=1 Tax=Cyclotella cryptica TaxID=29204 RepID=A0ABD3QGL4_9STRA|eukprot:CCRYP_005605-RA/>CCRYP_005605-RA protein AED:0.03 eAED:0.03 QI:144/1/1/1/1/1/2/172/442